MKVVCPEHFKYFKYPERKLRDDCRRLYFISWEVDSENGKGKERKREKRRKENL